MARRISVALVSIPTGSRDLLEFAFFIAIGFTAGSLGLIWNELLFYFLKLTLQINLKLKKVFFDGGIPRTKSQIMQNS